MMQYVPSSLNNSPTTFDVQQFWTISTLNFHGILIYEHMGSMEAVSQIVLIYLYFLTRAVGEAPMGMWVEDDKKI